MAGRNVRGAATPSEPDLTAFTYIFGTVVVMRKKRRAIKQIVEPGYKPKYDRYFWFTSAGKAKSCTPEQIKTFEEI
jgi:hypothetical protein